MGFDLPGDLEQRLREEARRRGRNVDAVVAEMLSDEFQRIDCEHAEVVNAVRQADEAVAEGRERPLSAFLAAQRTKYGFPREWPNVVSDKDV